MDPTSISELERQEQEGLAALKAEFPHAEIVIPGCDHRYAIRLTDGFRDEEPDWFDCETQWWEDDTLPAVRQRIVWALAHR